MMGVNGRIPERVLDPAVAITTFDEVRRGYAPAAAISEAQRATGLDLSAARERCPFGVDVRALADAVASGRFDDAREVVERSHPWPGTMGRHCGRYCESSESQPGLSDTVALGLIERSAGDYGRRAPGTAPLDAPQGRPRFAVIGAGASGSAVAYGLRQRGHAVTVIEALPRPGGMLYAGYPGFRMPLDVLEAEFDLSSWGVSVELSSPVTKPRFEQLRREYDAVIVANGMHREIPLGVPGEDSEGVLTALELLTAAKEGARPDVGEHVIVIGAGHTAQDAARTCRRLGARVTIVYRGTMERMPVSPGKQQKTVERLAAEGIEFLFEHAVDEVLSAEGRVGGVRLRTTALGHGPGQQVGILDCTSVVKATGVFTDLDFLPDQLARTEEGLLEVDDRFETSMPGVFAIGTITGTRTTSGTLAEGLRAAAVISSALKEAAV